jgi:hypothetical protein
VATQIFPRLNFTGFLTVKIPLVFYCHKNSESRIMKFLSRTELLSLTGDSVDRFDTRVRSGRLPAPQPNVTGRKRGKYTRLEALVMMICNHLIDDKSVAQERAVQIASYAYTISGRMSDIADTSADLESGLTPTFEIFFALVMQGNDDQSWPAATVAVCGTFAEIARDFANPISIDLVNVSRIAAVMRMRATRSKIDLEEFWKS